MIKVEAKNTGGGAKQSVGGEEEIKTMLSLAVGHRGRARGGEGAE